MTIAEVKPILSHSDIVGRIIRKLYQNRTPTVKIGGQKSPLKFIHHEPSSPKRSDLAANYTIVPLQGPSLPSGDPRIVYQLTNSTNNTVQQLRSDVSWSNDDITQFTDSEEEQSNTRKRKRKHKHKDEKHEKKAERKHKKHKHTDERISHKSTKKIPKEPEPSFEHPIQTITRIPQPRQPVHNTTKQQYQSVKQQIQQSHNHLKSKPQLPQHQPLQHQQHQHRQQQTQQTQQTQPSQRPQQPQQPQQLQLQQPQPSQQIPQPSQQIQQPRLQTSQLPQQSQRLQQPPQSPQPQQPQHQPQKQNHRQQPQHPQQQSQKPYKQHLPSSPHPTEQLFETQDPKPSPNLSNQVPNLASEMHQLQHQHECDECSTQEYIIDSPCIIVPCTQWAITPTLKPTKHPSTPMLPTVASVSIQTSQSLLEGSCIVFQTPPKRRRLIQKLYIENCKRNRVIAQLVARYGNTENDSKENPNH